MSTQPAGFPAPDEPQSDESAAEPEAAPREQLTPAQQLRARDYAILDMIACGWQDHEIARELGLAPSYVRKLVVEILNLSGQDTRLGLILWYLDRTVPGRQQAARIYAPGFYKRLELERIEAVVAMLSPPALGKSAVRV